MDSGPSGDRRGLLRLKYLNKAIIRHPRKDKRFISSKVYRGQQLISALLTKKFHEVFFNGKK